MSGNRLPHAHVPFEKIGDYADFIINNKLNLEIYLPSSALDSITTESVSGLKEMLSYSPSISFHAPFMDLSPAAVDSKVRAATMDRFNQVLDIAEILKPLSIVVHSGYEKWKYALVTDLWLKKSVETWIPLNERAKSIGTKIAVENIMEEGPSNIVSLMEAVNSDNFGVCFDTGHFNLFSKSPLSEWIGQLRQYIVELHIHDNDKSSDQHLPIGDGNFDFKDLFLQLNGKDCIHTIESHSPEKVMKSMGRLRELFAN